MENQHIDQLYKDLAFSVRANRPDAEAVVITSQTTVREVLTEIERLKDRIANPQYHIERYTVPAPELTEEEKRRPSPVPVIPWRDYGSPRQG